MLTFSLMPYGMYFCEINVGGISVATCRSETVINKLQREHVWKGKSS